MLKPIAILAALAGLIAYAAIMLGGPQGLRALADKRRQIRILEEENANLRRDVEAKKLRIERLKSDPGTQEIEVEKHLGKVRPGVTEFRELGQHGTAETGKSPAAPTDSAKPTQP